ncbi:helicase family member protein [Theileria equi strain WA]|uniref:Helicase family member protein n=1 Tax=Theileria equi strain WA TaxID=1537102 RepID=L0B1L4_THEEQ|nr:helicase family member protein [Theileria equi strain WA]AFZ81725.1 helicase family member protein [Theileria equi strain WA]|eukprot:XP_004831391.1 helicase family member protein [Theileria equi strain WA]
MVPSNEDAPEPVFTFGKHRGRTFLDVYNNDVNYVNWMKSLSDPSDKVLEFCNFIANYETGIKVTNSNCEGQSFDSDTTFNSPNVPSLDHAIKPYSSNTHTPKRSLSDLKNQENYKETLCMSSEKVGSLNKRQKYSTMPTSNDSSIQQFSPSEFNSPSLQDIFNSLESKNESCVTTQTPGDTTHFLEFEGVIALVLYSESEFYISYCKSINANYTRWSYYVPPQLYEHLNKLCLTTTQRLIAKDKCTTYKASDYNLVLKSLRNVIRDKSQIETIPNFILRTFPSFSSYAKDSKLPQKTMETLFDNQSPYTKRNAPNLSSLIGEELYRELKPFQHEGVEFGIRKNGRVLIGDEMGLGKTLQALAISAFYSIDWPMMIVCPSSLRFQWRDQCIRWLPHLVDHGDIFLVKNGRNDIPLHAKVVIISYDLLTKNERFRHNYRVIVIDESHYLKNRLAKRTKQIVPLIRMAKRAILLSGTPALNLPSELYEQISCIIPEFSSYNNFVERYCEKKKNWYTNKMEYVGSKHTHELHLFLVKTVMIRRLKENVLHELPPKIRSKIPIELPPSFLKSCKAALSPLETRILSDKDSDNFEEEFKSFQDIFRMTGEAKCKGVCQYIEHLIDTNIKFLIFAHHMIVMDSIEDKLKEKGANYIRIDGSTSLDKREAYVNLFQTDKHCKIALLSLSACGVGLNLTASSTVVFAELFWVPGQMIQAEDRAHRLGTKHTSINIHYLIAENSVEETVWKVINRKWETITSTLNGQISNLILSKDDKKNIPQNQHSITKMFNL